MSLLLNSTTAKTAWDFDPRSIPDCDIWFDAADVSTLTVVASIVKTWTNKGSLNMNAIEDTVGANGGVLRGLFINGLSYLSIPVGTHMSFTCPLTSQSRSWFIVAQATTQLNVSGGANPLFWGPVNQTAGNGQDSVVWTRPTNTGYSPNTGASGIANILGSATLPNPFNTVGLLGMVYNNVTTTLNRVTYNGLPYTVTTNVATNSYNTGNIKYTIGTAAYATGTDICEILHYNRDVSQQERIAIEGYLMWKWGIAKNVVPERQFIPTSISGCLLWHDSDVNFNDATSRAQNFTFSSGDVIATWLDKSGNNRTSTAVASPVLAQNIITGKSAVAFNGTTQYFTNALSLATNQSHTLFTVSRIATSKNHIIVSLNGNTATTSKLSVYVTATTNLYRYTGGTGTNGPDGLVTALGQVDINSFYWKGTAPVYVQMNTNGHYIPLTTTGIVGSLTASATTIIGAEGTSKANFLNGHIAEIILYNGILSVEQRNQVERYLSIKWNRPLVNACSLRHPNKWVPDFARNFIPTDITGCQLWLDAADASSITLAEKRVIQWNDKSGNGRNATQATDARRPTYSNNNKIVFVRSFQHFLSLPDGSIWSPANSSLSIFIVFAPTSTYTANVVLFQGTISPANALGIYTTGTAFSDYMQNSAATSWGSMTVGTSYITGYFYTQNTNVYQSTNGTYALVRNQGAYSAALTNATIGAEVGRSLYSDSEIQEIIIYNTAITAGERRIIEGYLASKWERRAILPIAHPSMYSSAITDIVNFVPTSISGCKLWIDASDISTVNNGLITVGGTVTSLTDKSGNNVVLTAGGTPTWNYTMNKLPGITLTTGGFSGNFLSFPLTNFINTTFIVSSLNSYPTAGYPCVVYTNSTTTPSRILRVLDYATTLRSVAFYAASSYVASNVTTPTNTPFVWSSTHDGSSVLNNSQNVGKNTGTISGANPGFNFDGMYFWIGQEPGIAGYTWTGPVSEIIVYASVLSAANRTKVEQYLARKWGATQLALTANQFINPGVIPNTPRIYPTTFTDIALWLDGADPDADGIVPTTGAKISSWIDKSGNNKPCVQTTVSQQPTFTYDGIYPCVQFASTSSQTLTGSSVMTSTNYGIFVVSKYTGSTGSAGKAVSFFDRKVTTASANNYIAVYDYWNLGTPITNVDIFYNNAASSTYKSAYATSLLGTRVLTSIADNSAAPAISQQVIFFNGTSGAYSFLNNATANVATDAEGYRLGVSNIGGVLADYLTGNIYEVIVMLHLPTDNERRFIEGYLAWKWGLNPNLPTTHPYQKVTP